MPSMFDDVAEFNKVILGLEPGEPAMLDRDASLGRVAFMMEELVEYIQAYRDGDIVGTADALADLVYVALGTAYQMGLPFNDIWAAVHRANMDKKPGMTKRGLTRDAIKPVGWVGPESEIREAINATYQS